MTNTFASSLLEHTQGRHVRPEADCAACLVAGPPEIDATPDEAFDLGHVQGYDEAMQEAHLWAAEGIAYFEQHAAGETGQWWLGQIRKVFGGPIEAPEN